MLTEQYTADAICSAMGLPAFIERSLPLPALRLLLMPSFDPEVCITLAGAAGDERLSVVALTESLWQQAAPRRLSAWREHVELSTDAVVHSFADFGAAVAANREVTGRIACIDGMPVEGCSITGTGVERIACHPYRPAVSGFVSKLIRLAWESCSGPGVRNGLAACARYVGVNLPPEATPPAVARSRVVILGGSDDRADLLEQLARRGEPV
ncbi:hypothetical protein [Sorangium sp. So ce341]|uniref:hypothetical protein n=1 Tax=Sorangium sp. So ce341 TaxID=3133302 RepID=UPI003F5F7413